MRKITELKVADKERLVAEARYYVREIPVHEVIDCNQYFDEDDDDAIDDFYREVRRFLNVIAEGIELTERDKC